MKPYSVDKSGCTGPAAFAAWSLRLPALVLAALVAAMVAVAWGAA